MTRPTLPPDAAGAPDGTAATPKRTCQVAGCDRPHKARGMCYPHWKRQWRAARKRKRKPPPPPTPPLEQAVRCLVCGDLTSVSKLARAGGRPLKVCRHCRTVTRQTSTVGDVSAVPAAALEPHRITVTCTAGCRWTVPVPDSWRPDMWALAEAAVSHLLRAPGCTGRPQGVYDDQEAAA